MRVFRSIKSLIIGMVLAILFVLFMYSKTNNKINNLQYNGRSGYSMISKKEFYNSQFKGDFMYTNMVGDKVYELAFKVGDKKLKIWFDIYIELNDEVKEDMDSSQISDNHSFSHFFGLDTNKHFYRQPTTVFDYLKPGDTIYKKKNKHYVLIKGEKLFGFIR